MSVIREEITDDIREYTVSTGENPPKPLFQLQVGRYMQGDLDHYILLRTHDKNIKREMDKIVAEIQDYGFFDASVSRLPIASHEPYETEMQMAGKRLAPINQLECFGKILDGMREHKLCADVDLLKLNALELSAREKANSFARG